MRELVSTWGINIDYCFVTDAAKVHFRDTSGFDTDASTELLRQEIELCKPNLVILLGVRPLSLIDPQRVYRDVVGESFVRNGMTFVVSPFPIGQGRTQRGFREKLHKTTQAILQIVSHGEFGKG